MTEELNLLEVPVTYLPDIHTPSRFESIPLKTALGRIKKGRYKDIITSLRTALIVGDEDDYKNKKRNLPSYAFHGNFENIVSNEGFRQSNGLFHIDIDNLNDEQLSQTRSLLISDPHTVFVFTSTGGNGLKAAFRVDPAKIRHDADFKLAFTQIAADLAKRGVTIDPSCKDVRRVSFVSYDEDLYFNRNATEFNLAKVNGVHVHAVPDDEQDYVPISVNDYIAYPLNDITLEDATEYLKELAADPKYQSYEPWYQLGMALHHQFNGSEEALALFDTVSAEIAGYEGSAAIAAKWASFGKRKLGPQVTFRSLIHALGKTKVSKQLNKDNSAITKANRLLKECTDDLELIRDIGPRLWHLADQNVVLEKAFITAFIARDIELRGGVPLTRQEALRALKMPRSKRDTSANAVNFNNPRTPEWAKGWVWISAQEMFFNIHQRIALTSNGFRGHFDSFLPTGVGAPTDSAKWLRDSNLVPKVMDSMYMPSCDALFTYSGVQYVNSYNDLYRATVPDTVVNPRYVEIFKQHLTNLCGSWNREALLLANFLRYCTESPPIKVRWAPLLIGTFGDGKSVFRNFVASAIGLSNTRTISCSTINSSATTGFSGWAEGHCFGFIDELKMQGHNKHDAMNNLKDYLTNDIVACCHKGKETRDIPNCANYWFNSNFRDAAPIEKGNRRLFVIYSAIEDPEKMPKNYYEDLHKAVSEGAGDIVRWLRDLPLHPDFKPDGHAPMTEAKKTMIRLTNDDLTDQVEEILEDDRAPEYCPEVVLFDVLYGRLSSTGYIGLRLDNPYKLTVALTQLKFIKLGRARVMGERHSIWARRRDGEAPTIDWAKNILEENLERAKYEGLI